MHLRRGPVGADPGALEAYVAAVAPAGEAVRHALRGLADLVAGWDARPSEVGGRLGVGAVEALTVVADEVAYADLWVGRVVAAFVRADAGSSPGAVVWRSADALDRFGPPVLAAAALWRDLVVEERDRPGHARVVRLALDVLPRDVSALEWELLAGALGIDGSDGPVHLVVHGWGTSTAGALAAGMATAELYDEQGVADATVVVVDWAAGDGAGGLDTRADLNGAEASARRTGDALAQVLGALAVRGSDAPVTITAHSLGVAVTGRALAAMDDPSGRFGVDLVALQPATPALPAGDDGLRGARVRDLTVTVNEGDDALFWYELQGPEALGDEAMDGAGLTALVEARARAGLRTEVVDHNSTAGHGHLGLTPGPGQGLVRSLTQESIDRARRDGRAQTDLRRWIYATWSGPDSVAADLIVDHPAVEAYLSRCQRAGVAPTEEGLRALVATSSVPR